MKSKKIPVLLALSICYLGICSVAQAQVRKQYNVFLRSNIGSDTLWDGKIVRIFGMASKLSTQPTLPAATLYCNEGDTLVLNALSISQGDHHTIHLHGLDADTRNDGDPATSFALAHMQDTTYSVFASHAGTYIYHCHETDVIHVQMGMYGLVVVRPKDGGSTAWTDGPHYDASGSWLMSELDKSWHDNIPKHDTTADTIHVPPYRPGYFLVNGKSQWQLDDPTIRVQASPGSSYLLRLANIGFFSNRVIFPSNLNSTMIASDGRPLATSIRTDTVDVAPGERYDVMLTFPGEVNTNIAVQYINMNTDSVWDVERVPVGTSKAGVPDSPTLMTYDATLHLFPNPTHSQMEVKGAQEGALYTIVDRLGRTVQQGRLTQQRLNINLAPGTYIIIASGKQASFVVE